jgi:hypothetical protein
MAGLERVMTRDCAMSPVSGSVMLNLFQHPSGGKRRSPMGQDGIAAYGTHEPDLRRDGSRNKFGMTRRLGRVINGEMAT